MHFNKKNNNRYVITAATIFTLAIMTQFLQNGEVKRKRELYIIVKIVVAET
jgi:hypothetical protein